MVDLCNCYYYNDEQIEEFKEQAMETLLKYTKELIKLEEIENEA